ncbi:MAG: CotH kinase family protein [Proteobacteria bacterium]|nr:CotH kinase family protein [Pseudomonadota bacterium]
MACAPSISQPSRPNCPLVTSLLLAVLVIFSGPGCHCTRAATQGETGQLPDDFDPFYALDLLPELHISLDRSARDKLAKKPRKYVRGELTYNGVIFAEVAVRLKGHRSMRKLDDKPAFKLRFDKYDPDGRFLGQKKLTLNNMVEDPTMLREILGYRVYREAGVPAPRVGYATVTLNGERKGLYAIVENIDDLFLASTFADPSGNLYEGEYGCDLYPDDVPGFEHDEGSDKSRADLAAFADVASGPAESLFGSESPLEMTSFVGYLAVSAFIGDFDGYRHSHNYRIYHEPTLAKWYFVPWGIDRVFKKNLQIYDSAGLLAKRCFAHPPCRLAYVRTMRQVVEQFERLQLEQGVTVVSAFIDDAARSDPHKPYSDDKTIRYRGRMLDFLRERPSRVDQQLACLDARGQEVDNDGDGYGCMDCNDKNPAIHPGAAEVCDRIDNDCSGLKDDAAQCPCPTHEISGQTFHFCNLRMTWADANQFCKSQGVELARIDSVEMSRALYRRARKYNKERWWIGLNDRDREDAFVWSSGAPVEFTYWARGEPDNDACNQDCAALKEKGRGRWHDTHCAQRRPFLCR